MNFSFQLYRSGQPNWKYTVWEFQNFDTTQILREINFGHLRSSEFWIFWHFQVWNFSKNQNSMPSKLLVRQFLTYCKQLKLISLKIAAGKMLIFYSVEYPKLKFAIRLPRSVLFQLKYPVYRHGQPNWEFWLWIFHSEEI